MKEYKPKLYQIYREVAIIVVSIGILYYTGKVNLVALGTFGFGYLIFRIGVLLPGICGVRLDDDAIIIRYLIPFKKEKRIDYYDVESYSPIKLPRGRYQKPFMAMLKERNKKNCILLSELGIHGFDELNAILTDALPPPERDPDRGVNSESLRSSP